jgi:hypothetical protein
MQKTHEENRANMALRIVATVAMVARKRGIDPLEMLVAADSRDWHLYARLAGGRRITRRRRRPAASSRNGSSGKRLKSSAVRRPHDRRRDHDARRARARPVLIIGGFGVGCFFRCLLASFRPTPVTFLAIVYGVA